MARTGADHADESTTNNDADDGTDIAELRQGDRVEVVYESTRGGTLSKTGTVTYISDSLVTKVNIDTGDEYDDGTPKTFEADEHGRVESHGRVQKTRIGNDATVFVTDAAADTDGDTDGDTDDDADADDADADDADADDADADDADADTTFAAVYGTDDDADDADADTTFAAVYGTDDDADDADADGRVAADNDTIDPHDEQTVTASVYHRTAEDYGANDTVVADLGLGYTHAVEERGIEIADVFDDAYELAGTVDFLDAPLSSRPADAFTAWQSGKGSDDCSKRPLTTGDILVVDDDAYFVDVTGFVDIDNPVAGAYVDADGDGDPADELNGINPSRVDFDADAIAAALEAVDSVPVSVAVAVTNEFTSHTVAAADGEVVDDDVVFGHPTGFPLDADILFEEKAVAVTTRKTAKYSGLQYVYLNGDDDRVLAVDPGQIFDQTSQ